MAVWKVTFDSKMKIFELLKVGASYSSMKMSLILLKNSRKKGKPVNLVKKQDKKIDGLSF